MKKLMKILPVILVMVLVLTNAFAVNVPSQENITSEANKLGAVESLSANVWSTVVIIIQILAVAAVVFAGLRYMFASADQKADIKKSMGILAVGAILVFAATTVVSFVVNVAKDALSTK